MPLPGVAGLLSPFLFILLSDDPLNAGDADAFLRSAGSGIRDLKFSLSLLMFIASFITLNDSTSSSVMTAVLDEVPGNNGTASGSELIKPSSSLPLVSNHELSRLCSMLPLDAGSAYCGLGL